MTRPAPTLSGRSPTRPSRASVLGVAAVVTALALGGMFWWWGHRPGVGGTSSRGDITSAQVGALTAPLVGNRIDLARAALHDKDYRGAIAQAERALRLDADSGEARQVIAEAEAQLAADRGPAATAHDPAIRRLIAEYARALEGRDLALVRTVKPNLSGEEEKRLQDAFKAIKWQQVRITIDSIQVDGGQATVRGSRQDTIDGKPMRAVHQTFRLVQGGTGWTIHTIGQ